jgi:phage regulator Rha-like protein
LTRKKSAAAPRVTLPVVVERIERKILLIRGQKVMLDDALAELYRVSTKALKQAVRRNRDRFPADFLLELTAEEAAVLRSQIVTLEKGRGKYTKYAPYAFTEQGVAMLSSVLKSKRAVQMNILIVRAFVRLREVLATHRDLARKLEDLERRHTEQSSRIDGVYKVLQQLIAAPPKPKRAIGFLNDAGKR